MFSHLKALASRGTFWIGLTVFTVAAQDYMPPDKPPPADFQVQGEYFGEITGGGKLGAWVIGQGGDKFNVVFLPGGLLELPQRPGFGAWDKTTKINANGSAANITGTGGNGYKASISGTGEDRTMTGTTGDGKAFTLKRVVRTSPTLGISPKAEWKADTWFRFNNQQDLSNWAARYTAPQLKYGGYLYRGIQCNKQHSTVYLHIEVRSPYCPTCRDQDRGNSGIYLRGMHEMQVLDSFGLNGANNELGSIYRVKAPIVNAALPPLTWQTYDCYYTPSTTPNSATFTVYLNGVLVQNKTPVTGITEAGFSGNSLYLQDHGHDIVFNNIWAVANATEATLPWEDVLAQDTLQPTPLAMDHQARLSKGSRFGGILSRSGQGALVDLLGRKMDVLDANRLLHSHAVISAEVGKEN